MLQKLVYKTQYKIEIFKNFLRNAWRLRKELSDLNDIDYSSSLNIFNKSLGFLGEKAKQVADYIDNGGVGISGAREISNKISRVNELIGNLLEDNYLDRAAPSYIDSFNDGIKWVKLEDGNYAMEKVGRLAEFTEEETLKFHKDAESLAQRELDELFELLKNGDPLNNEINECGGIKGWWL